MRVSICGICGNEEIHVERFIRSFAKVADEFVLVRAIGLAPPDATETRAKELCAELGIPLVFSEYFNHPDVRLSWPHVDDFAKARQQSFDLAMGDWLCWADLDDVWPDTENNIGLVEKIKAGAFDELGFSMIRIKYEIPDQKAMVTRERFLSKKANPEWHNPIHEDASVATGKMVYVDTSSIVHAPLAGKGVSINRNLRILEFATGHAELYPDQAALWFYKQRELTFAGRHEEAVEAADKALLLLNVKIESDEVDAHTILLYEILIITAEIALEAGDASGARARVHGAVNVMPGRREAYGMLARIEHREGNFRKMLAYTSAMRGLPEPKGLARPWTQIDSLYSWHGAFLHHQALRLCGKIKEAEAEEENVFQMEGATISIIHPTMCRPELALETYNKWMSTAINPGCVQYIFAVDRDDGHTQEHLRPYKTVLSPRGARQAAEHAKTFATGKRIEVISDFWEPVHGWDQDFSKVIPPRLEYKLGAPYEGYPNIIITESPRYVICGKWGKSSNPDFEPQHCNFELGWEVNTAHVYAKCCLGNGSLRREDVIVTLPGREFLYQSCFDTVWTWEEFCGKAGLKYGTPYIDVSGPKTLDMVRYFERNWHRYDKVYFGGPGMTWNGGHWDLIQSIAGTQWRSDGFDFLLLSLRNRPHESRRNTPDDFNRELIIGLRESLKLPIFLVGLNLPDYGDYVQPISLREFANLTRDPHCRAILGPHSGPNGLAGLLAPKDKDIILFPMEFCPSIDNNYPSGMGKCLNLNGNKRHWLPVLSSPADIVAKTVEVLNGRSHELHE